jgi:hypothetical protein
MDARTPLSLYELPFHCTYSSNSVQITLIIYEIFRHKSGTKAVKNESKSKPPLLVNVRFFSFPSGQRVQKAEIGHKKKRTTSFVPLFVPLFACRHFSYIFTVRWVPSKSGKKKCLYHNGFDRSSVRQKTQKSKIDTQSAGFDSLPAPVYTCVNLSFKGVRLSIDCHCRFLDTLQIKIRRSLSVSPTLCRYQSFLFFLRKI